MCLNILYCIVFKTLKREQFLLFFAKTISTESQPRQIENNPALCYNHFQHQKQNDGAIINRPTFNNFNYFVGKTCNSFNSNFILLIQVYNVCKDSNRLYCFRPNVLNFLSFYGCTFYTTEHVITRRDIKRLKSVRLLSACPEEGHIYLKIWIYLHKSILMTTKKIPWY